jgi:RND family efflux transporter MFP subunit
MPPTLLPLIAKRLPALLLLGAAAGAGAVPAPLATAAVELRQVPRQLRLDGVVEAVHQSTVSAQTGGQVQQVLYDVDDYVEKGALLLVLDDREQHARVVQAAAELRDATARLEEARDDHARTKGVFARHLVAAAAMDKAAATLKSARARFEAAQAGLSQAETQLGYARVRAPYSGVVTQRLVQVGETARPGQPLLSGIALDRLRVLVDVPQSDAPLVRAQAEARVQVPTGGWIRAASVTVFPMADPGSNSFRVRLDLPADSKGLFPGMYVKADLTIGQQQDLVVPQQAVVHRSEVTAVYVLDAAGRVGFRHVRVGRDLGDGGLLVLSGLEAGERVALDPIAAGVELKRQRGEGGHE